MTTLATPTASHSSASRLWSTARLYVVNRWMYFGIPWFIMAIAATISVVIALLIRATTNGDQEALDGMRFSWAVLSPLWYLVAAGVMAISATFPFALALTLTRREFYLGTSLMFVLVSAANAVAWTVLTELERLTSGWGIGMKMFTSLWFGVEPWYVNLLAYFSLQVLVLFVGASVATIYMRWRITGMVYFWAALAVVVLGVVALVVLTGSGPGIVEFVLAIGVAGAFGLCLLVALVAAVFGYLVLRRATVKNA